MDNQEIHSLLNSINPKPKLLETHISWVLVGQEYTYKIKKPILLSFLDYSSLSRRKFLCQKEVDLNRRYSPQMYLGISSICKTVKGWEIDDAPPTISGEDICEFAVRMKTMDAGSQMDKLLKLGKVSDFQIHQLGEVISKFHLKAEVVDHFELSTMVRDFNDILYYISYFSKQQKSIINDLVNSSDRFIRYNKKCIKKRSLDGLVRDLHGDLHPGNIFLLDPPILFDCIEFSDHLRKIDVFAEIGFFLMDLEFYGYSRYENIFINSYQKNVPAFRTTNDTALLKYYKMYRANVKAKIFAIRYIKTQHPDDKIFTSEYLDLAHSYKDEIFNE